MYDLIVIGDDLSSHVAAALASHYGQKTALISESGIGGLYLIDDFVFNIDPTPLTGFGANQAGLRLMAELNLPTIEQESILLDPAYQVILPEQRIDFFNDKEVLMNELNREFPELEMEIKGYYNSIIKNSAVFSKWLQDHPFVQPQSFKDFIQYLKIIPYVLKFKFDAYRFDKILSQNINLKKLWEAQEALLSFTTGNHRSFSSHYRYNAPLQGIRWFAQGKQMIFNSLIEIIESINGLYLNNYQIISIQKGKLIDLEIKGKDGTISSISARNLIVSTKWDGLKLLLGEKENINISDWLRPADISFYPFTIHLGIPQKCLPEKIARHVAIVSDLNRDIYDDNLIILESEMPENESRVSKAKTSLTATVFLPNIPEIWSLENLRIKAASIIEQLDIFLPFLKDNIELIDINKSIDLSFEYRKVVNPKYKLRNSFFTGFAAKSNKTRFPNIYLTGMSLLLDAGFEGEIISGMNAASRVADKRQ